MKYKVGDKVKIREDLEVGRQYGADDFARGMEQYKGKTATIANVYNNVYHLEVDDDDNEYCTWHWTDEMLEGVFKFNVGDKVRVRRDLVVGQTYNGLTLLDEMYKNDIMTIERCNIENGNVHYICEESPYYFGEDMFEKIVEEKENVGMTVEDLLNKTDVEKGGLIITVYYPNAYFEATIGHNKINRNSELYKRFVKAYGDMIVDEISFDIRSENMVVMLIKVDYTD